MLDDVPDHAVRQARDVGENAVAAGLHRVVERVRRGRVAEHGQELELEQLLVGELGERLQPLARRVHAALRVVVVDHGGLLARDLADELLELHPDHPSLAAELHAGALDLLGHPRRQLGALEDDEHVVEHDRVLELERRQPRQHMVESLPVRLERRERLVRLREHVGDDLELVAALAEEDRDRLALLRDRDHERVGLLGHALGGAVPSASLGRRDRRVGHQLDVRVGEPADVGVDDDRPVHLRDLVEQLRREGKVELHPAGVEERQLVGIADHDQRALLRADDVVDPGAQLRARRDLCDRGQQDRVAALVDLGAGAGNADFGRPACAVSRLALCGHQALLSSLPATSLR